MSLTNSRTWGELSSTRHGPSFAGAWKTSRRSTKRERSSTEGRTRGRRSHLLTNRRELVAPRQTRRTLSLRSAGADWVTTGIFNHCVVLVIRPSAPTTWRAWTDAEWWRAHTTTPRIEPGRSL